MKIGYFITHFPYDKDYPEYVCGGAEVVAYNLAFNMLRRGHELAVFTTAINSHNIIERYNNLDIYRYGSIIKIGTSRISPGLLYKPLKYDVDIVHAHAGNPPAPITAVRYAGKRKKPLVVTYHGDPPASYRQYGGIARTVSFHLYRKYILDRVLRQADVIISPSEYFIGQSQYLGKYRTKTVVVPNGINLKDFDITSTKEECRHELGLSNDEHIILFVGSLSLYKGPHILVEAMPEIIRVVPNTRLIFLGDGPLRGKLENETRKLGLFKYVSFEGFIRDTHKKALFYKSSDIFVLPSTQEQECFGIVNLEAMASGIPIVASKVGGIPDLVRHEENGLLVPPNDPEALGKAIITMLENPELRNRMSEEAKKRIHNYSWEKVAEETERIYLEVAA